MENKLRECLLEDLGRNESEDILREILPKANIEDFKVKEWWGGQTDFTLGDAERDDEGERIKIYSYKDGSYNIQIWADSSDKVEEYVEKLKELGLRGNRKIEVYGPDTHKNVKINFNSTEPYRWGKVDAEKVKEVNDFVDNYKGEDIPKAKWSWGEEAKLGSYEFDDGLTFGDNVDGFDGKMLPKKEIEDFLKDHGFDVKLKGPVKDPGGWGTYYPYKEIN